MNLTKRAIGLSALIGMSASFLLCGYEFIRSPSNTLFQKAYGTENLPLVMALVIPGTFVALYIYGLVLSKLGPRKSLFVISIASGALLSGCYLLIQAGFNFATVILYVIREAYIILVIEQYWSFINSSLSSEEAKKVNGPIVGIASLGAILGGYLVSKLSVPLGTYNMLLFGAVSTLPAAIISDWAYKFGGEPTPDKSTSKDIAHKDHLALGLFKSSRLLLALFFLIMVTQVISAVLSLEFQTRLQIDIPNLDEQTAYSGGFFSILNAVAAGLQFVVAPLVLKFISAMWIQLLIPVCHLATISYLLIHPSLTTAGICYMTFKAFDYSIFRASKEILYIPLSFDARYRAKEVIDFLGYRFSKGGISLVIAIFQKIGFTMTSAYGVIAFVSAALWIGLVIPIFRESKHKTLEPSKQLL